MAAFAAGCSSSTPPNDGDAATPKPDAQDPDAQDPKSDAKDPKMPDTGDGGCTCDPGDGGFDGAELSLPCFCSRENDLCRGYDAELANCFGGLPAYSRLEEYADCNLAVIRSGGVFGGSSYVYNYTTHELVGARIDSDAPIFTCGNARVFGYYAGTFPAPSCVQTNVVTRCERDGGDAGDARTDAGDAPTHDVTPDAGDGGCTCDPGDGGSNEAELSLPCFCRRENDLCRGYDAALADCWAALPGFSSLEEYADCNLAVITNGWDPGGTKYVYDYTTHALVGASIAMDTPRFTCGSAQVLGYYAGSFPAPSCVRSKVVPRCGRDGGDEGADGG